MAKQVTITNGVGSVDLINGTYSVEANVLGYNNTTISPTSITVDATTNTYSLTIAADGILTLHVSEDGTASGTPIVGATFLRCDAAGTAYGDAITTDASGNAVFNNIPYATSGISVYFRQTASDGDHEFNEQLQSVTMTAQNQTEEIENALGAVRTINMTDANYDNLPIASGELTLNNE